MKHLRRLAAIAALAVAFSLPSPQVASANGNPCLDCHLNCYDTYEACLVYCQPYCG